MLLPRAGKRRIRAVAAPTRDTKGANEESGTRWGLPLLASSPEIVQIAEFRSISCQRMPTTSLRLCAVNNRSCTRDTKGITDHICRPARSTDSSSSERTRSRVFGLCRLLDPVAGRTLDDAALEAPIEALTDSGKAWLAPLGEPRSTMASSTSTTSLRPISRTSRRFHWLTKSVLEDASRLLARALAIAP